MGNLSCKKCGISQNRHNSMNSSEYSCREHRWYGNNICRDCGRVKGVNFGNCSHKWYAYCWLK